MTKHQTVLLIPIVPVMAICLSCRSSLAGTSAVEALQNGILNHFNNTTTVGKAFEGTFQNVKWSSLATPRGTVIVQLDATVTYGKLLGTVTLDEFERSTSDQLPHFSSPELTEAYGRCIASRGYGDELANAYQDWVTLEADRDDLFDATSDIEEAVHKYEAIETTIANCMNSMPISVKFQFALSADQNTFDVTYVDKRFKTLDDALSFVYQ